MLRFVGFVGVILAGLLGAIYGTVSFIVKYPIPGLIVLVVVVAYTIIRSVAYDRRCRDEHTP